MNAIDLVPYRCCFADVSCRLPSRVDRQRDQGRGGLLRCMRAREERRQRRGRHEIGIVSRRIGRGDAEEIARVSRERRTHRNLDVLLGCGDRPSGSIHALPGHDRGTRAVGVVEDLDLTEPRDVGDPPELDLNVRGHGNRRPTRELGRSSRQRNRDKEKALQQRRAAN